MHARFVLSALTVIVIALPAAARADCGALDSSLLPPPDISPIVPGTVVPDETPPTPLAEIAADSPWRARLAAAADELLPALQSGDPDRWQPLLGGQWLGAADRQAVAALLADRCGVFAPLAATPGPVARTILGWQIPASYSASERAEIAARPEAEALVCWSAQPEAAWPRTAAEADNRPQRRYACARIAYSVRGDTPTWRAFIEQGPGGAVDAGA